ncbi:MAG TPA: RNA methyltransferase [Salinivirgaceae bacterium]|nr:RNA methyltransferase [Salinivirgaceae bacterium]
MLSSTKIKLIRSLDKKKKRIETNLFVVEGEKMVLELFNSSFKVRELYHTPDFIPPATQAPCYTISQSELERISFLTTPNKVLAIVEIPKSVEFDYSNLGLSNEQLFLGLDSISDPGNFGTILRIANWYGVEYLFCSPQCVDCYSPKVVQASMGAIFRTKIIYSPLEEVIMNLRQNGKVSIVSSELSGKSLYTFYHNSPLFLILGNEAHGVSQSVSALCDHRIKIPSYPPHNTTMESLNVAIAAAVFCSEFRRRLSIEP